MQKLALWMMLSFMATASAATIPCGPQVTFSYESASSLLFDGQTMTAYVVTPAKFPTPAKTSYVSGPFTYSCNGVTARATSTSFELRGPVEKRLRMLVSPFREGELDTGATPGTIVLAFSGDYIYPNIRQDWYQERVFFTVENGQLRFAHEGKDYELFPDLVIGARVNGGALQPVFFEGKLTPPKVGPEDKLELYLKGEKRALDYLSLDFAKNVITLKNGVKFPTK